VGFPDVTIIFTSGLVAVADHDQERVPAFHESPDEQERVDEGIQKNESTKSALKG
jgi:hypothetical protein